MSSRISSLTVIAPSSFARKHAACIETVHQNVVPAPPPPPPRPSLPDKPAFSCLRLSYYATSSAGLCVLKHFTTHVSTSNPIPSTLPIFRALSYQRYPSLVHPHLYAGSEETTPRQA